ncbi:MAG: hypothetical protein ABSD52_14890 [Candidatus Cybelea sp.]
MLIVGAVALAAALAVWVLIAKPFDHGPTKAVAVSSSPREGRVVVPSPSPVIVRTGSAREPARIATRQLAVAKKPPATPTPVPATPAKPVATEPPPPPKKTAPPAPPAVLVDNFVIVRTLPQRVCIHYKVENVTKVEIINEGTGATVYTRDLDAVNGRVAENPQPICLRRGTGAGYELHAHGPGGDLAKLMSVPPAERGKRQSASP